MTLQSQETFNHIHRLHIKIKRVVQDLFAGIYRSAFKGKGLEFENVREYQPGDDIRSIDWNVTARLQHPYVKNFREERELTVILIVDISASSRFGSTSQLKSEVIAEIGAVLAFSAIQNQDKVSLILFSEEVELYLRPKKGLKHVLRVIRELLFFKPRKRGTNITKALSFLGKVQRRQAICFLLSDFLTNDDFSHQMAIVAKRHELVVIGVHDPFEKIFPKMGLIQFCDLETKEKYVIDTNNSQIHFHFIEEVKQKQQALKKHVARCGAYLINIQNDESYINHLKNFFKLRGRKR